MKNLVQILQQLQHLSPDEIVTQISDPLPNWVQGDAVTEEMIARYGEMKIVILNECWRDRPNHAEKSHKLATTRRSKVYYHPWRYSDYQTGTLRAGGSFWIRSRASYDRNPDEGLNI